MEPARQEHLTATSGSFWARRESQLRFPGRAFQPLTMSKECAALGFRLTPIHLPRMLVRTFGLQG